MANSNDMHNKKEPSNTQTTPPQKDASALKNKSNRSYLSFLSFIIAVIAIGAAAYTLTQNQALQRNIDNQTQTISDRLSDLKQQQSAIQTQIKSTVEALNQTEEGLKSSQKNLNQQLKLAMQERLYNSQDWMLLKARYYLELAQINNHWSDNIDTTIALQKQADAILSNLSTSKIYPVRQAIAQEITLLKSSSKLDVAGLLSQLDALQKNINKLPLPVSSAPPQPTTQKAKVTAPPKNQAWHQRLKNSMNVLEKLVVIRHNDENTQSLLSPHYLAIIRETVQLNLQEAQWAILQRDNAIYQLTLKQAIDNIKGHFDQETSLTTDILQQLKELQQINLTPKKINIDQSLSKLNTLINNHATTLPANTEPSGKHGESSQ